VNKFRDARIGDEVSLKLLASEASRMSWRRRGLPGLVNRAGVFRQRASRAFSLCGVGFDMWKHALELEPFPLGDAASRLALGRGFLSFSPASAGFR
jgi:hypothetical protein